MNEKIMSVEAFNELIECFEVVGSLTEYGRKNIKYHVNKLQQENKQLKDKYNKSLKLLAEYNLPCEIDSFNNKEENLNYCSENCSTDEIIFMKCWNRFIEQELGSDQYER